MSQERIELHTAAKELMKKNEWQKALANLYRARTNHGDNLMLVIDQAACEYMDGSMYSWRKTVQEIEAIYSETSSILSPNTSYNALLFLGKFAEEDGQFKKALTYYETISEGKFDDRHKSMAQAQLVRVLSLLGISKQRGYFIDLSTRLRAFKSDNQRVEILHGLMLADLVLMGSDAAIERYLSASAKIEHESDHALLAYDLVEGIFLRDGQATPDLTSLVKFPAPDNSFEKLVLALARGETITYRTSIAKLEQMSSMLQLRLFRLINRFGANESDRTQAAESARLILESFDSYSAKLLGEHFDLKARERVIEIDEMTLRADRKVLSWDRRPTAIALLSALSTQPRMDVEAIVREVWKADFNPSYSDRLRVLVNRINKDLSEFAENRDVLVLKGGHVHLAPGIRFQNRAV